MARQRTELPDYETAKNYTVISQEENEKETVTTIRTYNGKIVIARMPKHTPEEQKRIDEQVVRAFVKFANPGLDFSQVESYRLIRE